MLALSASASQNREDAMRLVTFRRQGQEEIGAFVDGHLQASHQLLAGRTSHHLGSMLAFLQGGLAARDTAQAALEFALSRSPNEVLAERTEVELLSPVPRPEPIREFMVFEQHIINSLRKFAMPRWLGALDEWLDGTFGRKATAAYRLNRLWYERPIYYKGNCFSVVGDGARVTIPRYCRAMFDWELECGIFLCKQGRDIPQEQARGYIGGYTIFNDFSARDIQAREMGGRLGPAKGKDFDGGNAIGPALVTPDEVSDPTIWSCAPASTGRKSHMDTPRACIGRSSRSSLMSRRAKPYIPANSLAPAPARFASPENIAAAADWRWGDS
jgi:2-keto-4-pentenoate hydratase/2-oxohepta-3-ene-1,7-dioic acid hydratase in catechol pathway